MRAGWIVAALLATSASSAQAQAGKPLSQVWADGSVDVWAGERVTLRFGPDGRPELVSATPVSEAEAAPPKPGQGRFDDPPAGTVVLVAGRDGERLRLKIESGQSRAFDYRVQLLTRTTIDSLTLQPAKACTALPLLSSFEDWPGTAATGVKLYDVRFRDTNEVVCAEPAQYPRPRPAPAPSK
jgi:hypothetical protein